MFSDSIEPAGPGFVMVTTRSGWQGLLAIDLINRVLRRSEGGTAIEVEGQRTLLLDRPFREVVAALREAGQGGGHAA